MAWREGLACFIGGAFLANFVPHLVAGVSGRRFPTPFAKPPFRGPSSPDVNVVWALCNLAAAWVLLVAVGELDLSRVAEAATAGAGFGLASLGIAGSVRRLQAGSR